MDVIALFDAMLCSENNIRDIEAYLKEIQRVLKTGGVFLIISHAAPGRRMNLLQPHLVNMEIEVQKISKSVDRITLDILSDALATELIEKLQLRDLVEDGDAQFHYMYICKKVQS